MERYSIYSSVVLFIVILPLFLLIIVEHYLLLAHGEQTMAVT